MIKRQRVSPLLKVTFRASGERTARSVAWRKTPCEPRSNVDASEVRLLWPLQPSFLSYLGTTLIPSYLGCSQQATWLRSNPRLPVACHARLASNPSRNHLPCRIASLMRLIAWAAFAPHAVYRLPCTTISTFLNFIAFALGFVIPSSALY